MTTPNSRVREAPVSLHWKRPRLSYQVKMVAVERRRLSPEKIAQLFRLARELEALGV